MLISLFTCLVLFSIVPVISYASQHQISSNQMNSKIRIATWNIANLHWEIGKHLPGRSNAPARSKSDFQRLQKYANRIDADIIALQEVNGPKAIYRVFPSSKYHVIMSDRYREDVKTRRKTDHIYTAIAIKRSAPIKLISSRTVKTISVMHKQHGSTRPTRRAVEAKLQLPNGSHLNILAVHLKSGCHQGNLINAKSPACATMSKQVAHLEQWIDKIAEKGEALMVLGDFNRRINMRGKKDHLWAEIDDAEPSNLDLFRLPFKQDSNCFHRTRHHKSEAIDYIIADKEAWQWIDKSSFRIIDYDKLDKPHGKQISDHCPAYVDMGFTL